MACSARCTCAASAVAARLELTQPRALVCLPKLTRLSSTRAAAVANETGYVSERPLESEHPSNAQEGVLLRVVGEDFIKRVVEHNESRQVKPTTPCHALLWPRMTL